MAKDRERRKGGKGGKRESERDRRRTPKKKVSILNTDSIKWIDYKDVNLLRRFMSERAKIRARRVTGNSAQQQRAVARAIRVAREMALLPYAVRQVTQRSKGGRGRDRGDRDILRDPMAGMAPPAAPDGPPPTPGDVEVADVEALDGDAVATDIEAGAENGAPADAAAEEIATEADEASE
jgi:small subunit ribosomal protein S18